MLKYLSRNVNQFIPSQSLGGVLLAVAALAALLLSNSPWGDAYQRFLHIPGELRLGGLQSGTALVLSKPLVIWVNDLWMAVFFFLVDGPAMLRGTLSYLPLTEDDGERVKKADGLGANAPTTWYLGSEAEVWSTASTPRASSPLMSPRAW